MVTLGRGGSDTSAVEIGGYLGAEEVVIYTDVPGVAVADPRIWPEAPYLPEINSSDMLELARWGAKVVHPRAVAAGVKHGVPIRVCSTFDDLPGTRIRPLTRKLSGLVGLAMLRHCSSCDVNRAGGICLSSDGSFVIPDGGGLAVVTVLCRPLPNGFPKEGLLPEKAGTYRDGSLLHFLVRDEEAPDLLKKLCGVFSGTV